jgi:hypothetical protein
MLRTRGDILVFKLKVLGTWVVKYGVKQPIY